MELLVPALSAGAKASPDGYSRIVTTSSSAAYLDTLHYDTMKDSPQRRKTTTGSLYYRSKLVCAH